MYSPENQYGSPRNHPIKKENHLPSTSSFGFKMLIFLGCTLPEPNIARENEPSQKETSIPTIHFQVRKC